MWMCHCFHRTMIATQCQPMYSVQYTDLSLCLTVHHLSMYLGVSMCVSMSYYIHHSFTVHSTITQFPQIIPTTDCQPHPPHCWFDGFLAAFWIFLFQCIHLLLLYIDVSWSCAISGTVITLRETSLIGIHYRFWSVETSQLVLINAFFKWVEINAQRIDHCFESDNRFL